MPRIRVRGRRIYAGRRPWSAWGFNWGIGDHAPVFDYFDDPSPAHRAVLAAELRTARAMGANCMRIFLEVGQVMESPTRARRRTLDALRTLLKMAERERVYLDITGDLVWRPKLAPAWYDAMTQEQRWDVQERFWHAVARAAHASPAVLYYELTSEPIIGNEPSAREPWYDADRGGWTFVQRIGYAHGGNQGEVARAWLRRMIAAVRAEDDRPVILGFLPTLEGGFAPVNVAGLLDVLTLHAYATTGASDKAIALVRGYAAFGKPVVLGETLAMWASLRTQQRFLLGSNRYVSGYLSFFDGRRSLKRKPKTISDAIVQRSLEQFVELRPRLLSWR